MATNNLELSQWGDGTTRLSLWDSLHGDDQIYVLHRDGEVLRVTCVLDDGVEIGEPVDLVAELRALAQTWADEAERVAAWRSTANFLYYWWKKARESKNAKTKQ